MTFNVVFLIWTSLFIFVSGRIENGTNHNNTLLNPLNRLNYTHSITVFGENVEFTFVIYNMTYATQILNIKSYYFSITPAGDGYIEERLEVVELPVGNITYRGVLRMENIEEGGHYVVCIIFINDSSLSSIIASSRFCHLVSLDESCIFDESNDLFNDRLILLLVPCAVVIFGLVIIFSIIRHYVYRPREIEAILKTLPEHHAQRLKAMANDVDTRRFRRVAAAAVPSDVEFDIENDNDFYNYHNYDNPSMEDEVE